MKLAWVTDPHLNFVDDPTLILFLKSLNDVDADAILITGDIAEGRSIRLYLHMLSQRVGKPIYFVLGNHDFYYSSLEETKEAVKNVCTTVDNLHWLTNNLMIKLAPNTCLIGHDSWYDCKGGAFITSTCFLSDFHLIDEYTFTDKSKNSILNVSNKIVSEAIIYVAGKLEDAAQKYDHIVFATHVPPFTQMAKYQGQPTSADFLPFFSCSTMGEILLDFKEKYPDKKLTILAGHTHDQSEINVDNMNGYVAGARYEHPDINRIIVF